MGKRMNGVVPEQFEPPATMEARIATLPHPSPEQIEEHLESLGFRGQEGARRAVALLSYRHGLRLRRRFLESVPSSRLLAREACLLNGPTGTGKTHLLNLLRDEVLDVPTVVVDLAQLSECTDVDQAISWVVSWLVDAAGGDRTWASCGVICSRRARQGPVPCLRGGGIRSRARLGPTPLASPAGAAHAPHLAIRHLRPAAGPLARLPPDPLLAAERLHHRVRLARRVPERPPPRAGAAVHLHREAGAAGPGRASSDHGDTIRWYRRELGQEVDFAPPAERQAQILEAALHGGGVHELLSSLGSLLDEFTQEWTEGANG